jgi:glutathione S-transferase
MAQGAKKIVWGAGTPRTLRAHWSMCELGLEYECRPIGSRSGETETQEYAKLNPSRKIPTLQDGDLVVAESAAIVNYLTTRYGSEKNMQPPTDPAERSRYDMWCFYCMMELDADTMYIIRRHGDLSDIYGEAPNAVAAAKAIFAKQVQATVQRLGSGPYAMCERFTGADILLTTCLSGAQRRDIALPSTLCDYLSRTTARDAYQRASEVNQRSGRN